MIEIAIFVLFHPQRLTIKPAPGFLLEAPGLVLAGDRAVGVRLESGQLDWFANRQLRTAKTLTLKGTMLVSVPGKIERKFTGSLTITPATNELLAVLKTDLEPAVATTTEWESPPGALLEAKKAQSVLVRSWYAANKRRHGTYDFCDTTHCQVFKDPRPSPASQETRGVVITYQSKPFAPAYSASCGGRTKTPEEIGWQPTEYPYFAVDCPVCAKNEPTWERTLTELPRPPNHESVRLTLNRKFGWSHLPSNNYVLTGNVARGKGSGHGVGYCQRGGAGLGLSYDQILRHFLPNTTQEKLPLQ